MVALIAVLIIKKFAPVSSLSLSADSFDVSMQASIRIWGLPQHCNVAEKIHVTFTKEVRFLIFRTSTS